MCYILRGGERVTELLIARLGGVGAEALNGLLCDGGFNPDRRGSLEARLLLCDALKRRGAAFPAIISRDPLGKPRLENSDMFFSLSHSGDYACCAVSDAPVGVDIQRVGADRSKVAGRVFSESENAFLAALPDGVRADAFYRLWVLKESLVKATGKGVAAGDMRGFSVTLPQSGLPPRCDCEGFALRLFEPICGYYAAVCRVGSEFDCEPIPRTVDLGVSV